MDKLYSDLFLDQFFDVIKPSICRCPTCSTYAKTDDLFKNEVDDYNLDYDDNSEVADLTMVDCIEALRTKVFSKSEDICQIRLLLMRHLNHQVRNPNVIFDQPDTIRDYENDNEALWIENLNELLKLLNEEKDEDCFLIAEIYRYQSRFDEAIEMVNKIQDVNYDSAKKSMIQWCEDKDIKVRRLFIN